jgi:hypothetical protein
LLQPAPRRGVDESAVDTVQVWRVRQAIFLQHMLDSARTASSPTVERNIDLKDAVVILPSEDNERVCHQLAVGR